MAWSVPCVEIHVFSSVRGPMSATTFSTDYTRPRLSILTRNPLDIYSQIGYTSMNGGNQEMNDDVKRGPGRPPQYVQYEGQSVEGLSGPKPPLESSPEEGKWADGRYYSTHKDPRTGSRLYFGTNLDEAVRMFRKWDRAVKKWRKGQ